jgi:hypothetical protein
LIDGDAADESVDLIAFLMGDIRSPQHKDDTALCASVAISALVEGCTPTVWGKHLRLAQIYGEIRVENYVDTANNGNIAIS